MSNPRRLPALLLAGALAASPAVFGMSLAQAEQVTATTQGEGPASITYDNEVDAGEDLEISGTGWTIKDGTAGSQITIKLKYATTDGRSGEYKRTDGILKHPVSGEDEATIWALVTADNDGSFRTTITLPDNLEVGQKLQLKLTSGLPEGADVKRSLDTAPLVVGGQEWVEKTEHIECVTDSQPQVDVADTPSADGTLHVTGKGWCNGAKGGGGARIAIKLDDAKYSRLNDDISPNRTIWQIVDADPKTGEFDINLVLPDGTESGPNGSTPAFPEGNHMLRFLSGSIKDNDPIRTFPLPGKTDTSFVVGKYVPSGAPAPLHPDELSPATRNGVKVTKTGRQLAVTIPSAHEGDWVYASTYRGNETRLPWGGQWFQADAEGKIYLPTEGKTFQDGKLKLVLQNGNQGAKDELLGWDYVSFEKLGVGDINGIESEIASLGKAIDGFDKTVSGSRSASSTSTPTTAAPKSPAASAPQRKKASRPTEIVETQVIGGGASPASGGGFRAGMSQGTAANNAGSGAARVIANPTNGAAQGSEPQDTDKPKPATTPRSPVKTAQDLNQKNVGALRGALSEDMVFTVKFDKKSPGDWVYVYSFHPDKQDMGWVQLDGSASLAIDASELGAGDHKFAFVAEDGKLIGWSGISLAAAEEEVPEDVDTTAVASARPLMNQTDWALIIGAVALAQVFAIGIFAHRAKRNNFGR